MENSTALDMEIELIFIRKILIYNILFKRRLPISATNLQDVFNVRAPLFA